MLRTTRLFGTAAFGILLGVIGCNNENLFTPANYLTRDPLFDRYVSVGNSITAGFQSGGINDSTQLQSYAVLLSRQMGTPFFVPLMNKAGCPPPIISVFSNPPIRVGPPPLNGCALRETQPVPPPYLNNVAVPGAYAYSILDNFNTPLAHPNALTTFFLGGYTQMGMLKNVDPTFVTVWIGNNDVLTAATAGGDTTLITDTLAFKASYRTMLDSIATTSVRGGVLIGVANVTLIPFFSKGSTYWAIKNGLVPGAAFPPNFAVSNTCAPMATLIPGAIGDSVLVPFPFGIPLIAAAAAGAKDTLYCTETQTVQPAELRKLVATVTTYNSFISAQAAARGFAYFDPNTLFTALPAGSIPAFPTIGGAGAVSAPFGSYFSRDGVHPTALSHKLFANALISLINATYNKSLRAIP
jgi:hypothetical protein